MKVLEFNYTKATGATSNRELLPLIEPTKYYEGIDITGMADDSFVEFITEYKQLLEAQYEARVSLFAKHDLKHSYRKFIPDNMTELISYHV